MQCSDTLVSSMWLASGQTCQTKLVQQRKKQRFSLLESMLPNSGARGSATTYSPRTLLPFELWEGQGFY